MRFWTKNTNFDVYLLTLFFMQAFTNEIINGTTFKFVPFILTKLQDFKCSTGRPKFSCSLLYRASVHERKVDVKMQNAVANSRECSFGFPLFSCQLFHFPSFSCAFPFPTIRLPLLGSSRCAEENRRICVRMLPNFS